MALGRIMDIACVPYGSGRYYVALRGYDGIPDKGKEIYYSLDLRHWQLIYTAEEPLTAITTDGFEVFVATGINGNVYATNINSTPWAKVYTGATSLLAVAFGLYESEKLFVAVGHEDYAGVIVISDDGFTWELKLSYGAALKCVSVAVSSDGGTDHLQVMVGMWTNYDGSFDAILKSDDAFDTYSTEVTLPVQNKIQMISQNSIIAGIDGKIYERSSISNWVDTSNADTRDIFSFAKHGTMLPPEPPPPSLPVGWWKGEDNTVDSINGMDATWHITPAYETGQVNRAFSIAYTFADNYGLSVANNPLFNFDPSGSFSIKFYLKSRYLSLGNPCGLVTKGRMFSFDWGVGFSNSAQIGVFTATSSLTYSDGVITDNNFHDILVSYNNGKYKVYLDGADVTGVQLTNNTYLCSNTSLSLYFCTSYYGEFDGALDEIMLFDTIKIPSDF